MSPTTAVWDWPSSNTVALYSATRSTKCSRNVRVRSRRPSAYLLLSVKVNTPRGCFLAAESTSAEMAMWRFAPPRRSMWDHAESRKARSSALK